MAYLFDTDAISELWRKKPLKRYLDWIADIDREEQFTSAVVIGELFKGAYRSERKERLLEMIEDEVIPRFNVLSYDIGVARVYGEARAAIEDSGFTVAEADLQIGATALYSGLTMVTGNVRHFGMIPGLQVHDVRG